MITIFSQRHSKALDDKKVQISLNGKLRQRIIYCFEKHDVLHGWDQANSFFKDELNQLLKENYGSELKGYVNAKLTEVRTTLEFIKTAWPPLVFDAIELFLDMLEPIGKNTEFAKELNHIFTSENSPYRLLDSQIIILDSSFLESVVLKRASELLKTTAFEQASRNFLNARNNFTAGDFNGVIFECNNAVESVLKKIVDKKNADQKDLKKYLMKAGLIPNYFQGFCDNFEGLLQSLFSIANNSVRHGKIDLPDPRSEADRPVASFVLHLTGSLLVFIMERYQEKEMQEEKDNSNDRNLL